MGQKAHFLTGRTFYLNGFQLEKRDACPKKPTRVLCQREPGRSALLLRFPHVKLFCSVTHGHTRQIASSESNVLTPVTPLPVCGGILNCFARSHTATHGFQGLAFAVRFRNSRPGPYLATPCHSLIH